MTTSGGGCLLNIQPTELRIPFPLSRGTSKCSLQLTNKTEEYVAFKVETSNPEAFCFRPNTGILLPGATCDVKVTAQIVRKEEAAAASEDVQLKDDFILEEAAALEDYELEDDFLVQSVIAPDGATEEDITPDMFDKERGESAVEEFELRATVDMRVYKLLTEVAEETVERFDRLKKELSELQPAARERGPGGIALGIGLAIMSGLVISICKNVFGRRH